MGKWTKKDPLVLEYINDSPPANELAHELASKRWLMDPTVRDNFISRINAIPYDELMAAYTTRKLEGAGEAFANLQARANGEAEPFKPQLNVQGDGTAVIAINGPMMKQVPSMLDLLGIEATSTVEVRDLVAQAVESPAVKSIHLDINSPGGTVEGTQELAEDILVAREFKPVTAHTTDVMASAAFWVGAMASTLTASPGAMVGSIGVYTALVDSSEFHEANGIKVKPVRSSPLKGIGIEGAEITDEQLADEKRLIDDIADLFVSSVARGRGITTDAVGESATGQVWLAEEAHERGLIDGVTQSRGSIQAPQLQPQGGPVAKELTMEDKTPDGVDLEAMLAEQAEAIKAQSAQIDAMHRAARDRLLRQYSDRYLPAHKSKMEEMGEIYGSDVSAFEEYLEALPSVARENVSTFVVEYGMEAIQQLDPVMSEEDRDAARLFQIPEEQWLELGAILDDPNFVGIDPARGGAIFEDGSGVEYVKSLEKYQAQGRKSIVEVK